MFHIRVLQMGNPNGGVLTFLPNIAISYALGRPNILTIGACLWGWGVV